MNINELFKVIKEKLQEDEIKGEFELVEQSIVWTYNDNNEDEDDESLVDYDEDENMFGFSTQTLEEHLIEMYQEDVEKLEDLLDSVDEYPYWNIFDFEINENIISFKITPKK